MEQLHRYQLSAPFRSHSTLKDRILHLFQLDSARKCVALCSPFVFVLPPQMVPGTEKSILVKWRKRRTETWLFFAISFLPKWNKPQSRVIFKMETIYEMFRCLNYNLKKKTQLFIVLELLRGLFPAGLIAFIFHLLLSLIFRWFSCTGSHLFSSKTRWQK